MNAGQYIPRLKRPAVSLWRVAIGWALICAGIIGMILPIVPGIPALLAGLIILAARYPWAAACLVWMRRRVRQVMGRGTAVS